MSYGESRILFMVMLMGGIILLNPEHKGVGVLFVAMGAIGTLAYTIAELC